MQLHLTRSVIFLSSPYQYQYKPLQHFEGCLNRRNDFHKWFGLRWCYVEFLRMQTFKLRFNTLVSTYAFMHITRRNAGIYYWWVLHYVWPVLQTYFRICKVHVVFQKKKSTLTYLQASFTNVHRQNATTIKPSRCSVICMRTGDF